MRNIGLIRYEVLFKTSNDNIVSRCNRREPQICLLHDKGVMEIMPSKTPEQDFKRFEKFIDGMEDIEFDYWYKFEATKKQRELAEQLREEIAEEDLPEGLRP